MTIIATARPDLLETRPEWASTEGVDIIRLEPLGASDAHALIATQTGASAIPATLADRIAVATGGNPLFIEEMVGKLRDDGSLRQQADGVWHFTGEASQVDLPASIRTLLASRIDAFPANERTVARRSSVVGVAFETPAAEELAPETVRPAVATLLHALLEREVLQPDRPQIGSGDAFRFRHVLIRAYDALLKHDWADLHQRFADWLERTAAHRRTEFEEVLAFHLDQAWRYRVALGAGDAEEIRQVRQRAALLAASAARRAYDRDDYGAAQALWSMAAEAAPTRTRDQVVALIEVARLTGDIGDRSTSQAQWRVAAAEAEALGDRGLRARAEVGRLSLLDGDPAELESSYMAMIPQLREAGELRGEADAWFALGEIFWLDGQAARTEETARESVRCLRALGDDAEARRQLDGLVATAALGPMPAGDGIALCRSLLPESRGLPSLELSISRNLALLFGMTGDFSASTVAIERAMAIATQVATIVDLTSNQVVAGYLAQLAGRPDIAVERFREALGIYESHGGTSFRARVVGRLADALLEAGREDEAGSMAAQIDPSLGDKSGRVMSLAVLARIAALRGIDEEARIRAKSAVELALTTDFPMALATAYSALGFVHEAAGRLEEAKVALNEAITTLERKGNLAGAGPLRRRLAAISGR